MKNLQIPHRIGWMSLAAAGNCPDPVGGAMSAPPDFRISDQEQYIMASKKTQKAKPAAKKSKPVAKKAKKSGKSEVVPVESQEKELPTSSEEVAAEPDVVETAPATDLPAAAGPEIGEEGTSEVTTGEGDTTMASQEPLATAGTEATATAATEEPAAVPDAEAAPKRKAVKKDVSGQPKKLSAIDAAAKVLAEAAQPMTCPEMIEAMAIKGYWTSPGGKTPASTLYAAILREIKVKEAAARFQKTERGKFAARG